MRRSTPGRVRPALVSLGIGATCALLLLPTQPASAAVTPLSRPAPAPAAVAQNAPADRDTKEAFVATAVGQPIARPAGLPSDAAPGIVAETFVRGGGAGGLARGESIRVAAVQAGARGGSVVRLQRLIDGVPVLGGEAVVDVDSDGNIRSVTSETTASTTVPPADPAVTAADARTTALGVTAREHDVTTGSLSATQPEQWIYDPRIVGVPGLPVARQVWRLEVTSADRPDIRQLVLVDAATGAVALTANQIHEALDRKVCDANSTTSQVPCVTPVRVEGGAASLVTDVNNAYDFAGDTYDFFKDLGRDSLDDAGMTLLSTVRWGNNYQNAFWDGSQMVYGAGFTADDVVGHELTHGVTEFSSDLFYMYQSGAINESLSDIFGEFVDLTNGAGTDTPEARWALAEDIAGGPIRNMKSPGAFTHPDTMDSANYYGGTDDFGGVHINSGVGNKFAYLITDGDSFNGQSVSGLGIPKAARIIYEASQLLTSGADYPQFASTLRQACTTLIGSVVDSSPVTSGDCAQVTAALLAVKMDQDPVRPVIAQAPVCASGLTAVDLFADDMENTGSGNWAETTAVGQGPFWFYAGAGTSKPGYPSGGERNLLGEDRAGLSDSSMELVEAIDLPAAGDVRLRFEHAFQFDTDTAANPYRYYDGGIVEYSTDGASWLDAKSLMTDNGYNGRLETIANDNPLAGRDAFVGISDRTSSRLDLSSLAGESVRFRFRIATDTLYGAFGWFVDNVRVYSCSLVPSAPTLDALTPGAGSLAVSATLGDTGGSAITAVQYRLDGGGWTSSGQASGSFTISGLQASTAYQVEVRAINAVGNSPASNALTGTTLAAPVVTPPASGGGSGGSGSAPTTPDPAPAPAPPVEAVPTPSNPPETGTPEALTPTVTRTSVTVRANARRSELRVVLGPAQASPRTFRVQVRTGSGAWRTLSRTYTARGAGKVTVIDLPKGAYRVVARATEGYSGITSRVVRLAR